MHTVDSQGTANCREGSASVGIYCRLPPKNERILGVSIVTNSKALKHLTLSRLRLLGLAA